jgi:hypothetical protein
MRKDLQTAVLFAGLSVEELTNHVSVSVVTSCLFNHVYKDPSQAGLNKGTL